MDDLLASNRRYAGDFVGSDLPAPPSKKIAILSCMDARLDIHKILGLGLGDAHVIRNAGGSVTEDAIRSLLISSLLETEDVLVIHHTDCRMRALSEDELTAQVISRTGAMPPFKMGALPDIEQSVSSAVTEIRENPLLGFNSVRGFAYDVATGLLDEIDV